MKLAKISSKANEIQADGVLASGKKVIAALNDRADVLFDRIDHEESQKRLLQVRALWYEYKRANELDQIALGKAIEVLLEAEYHDYKAWDQLLKIFEQTRKQVESHVKVLKDMQAIMTAEDAQDLAAQLLHAIFEAVDDMDFPDKPKFLRRINYEFSKIIGAGLSESDSSETDGRSDWTGSGEIIDAE